MVPLRFFPILTGSSSGKETIRIHQMLAFECTTWRRLKLDRPISISLPSAIGDVGLACLNDSNPDDPTRYQIVQLGALAGPRTIWGVLAGTLSPHGSCNVTITYTANGSTPSGTISVTDKYGTLNGSDGAVFCAIEDVVNGGWYFLTVGCPIG